MEKFDVLTGVAAPLLRDNVDTDAIIPAEWLRSVRADHAKGLFGRWRYDDNGRDNPDFILNDRRFRGARILIAGRNFGCGSSRENAVWALLAYGFRCVIAPSFGDIFRENSTKNGVLALHLERQSVEKLAETILRSQDPTEMTVDLVSREIRSPSGRAISFDIEARLRDFLLAGMDQIGLTLKHSEAISLFQRKDREDRPWAYPK